MTKIRVRYHRPAWRYSVDIPLWCAYHVKTDGVVAYLPFAATTTLEAMCRLLKQRQNDWRYKQNKGE